MQQLASLLGVVVEDLGFEGSKDTLKQPGVAPQRGIMVTGGGGASQCRKKYRKEAVFWKLSPTFFEGPGEFLLLYFFYVRFQKNILAGVCSIPQPEMILVLSPIVIEILHPKRYRTFEKHASEVSHF